MNQPLATQLATILDGAPAQRIAERLGVPASQATSAIGAALPLLLGALGRNASQPQGADSLFGALQRDHAGADVSSALGSAMSDSGQGDAILGHVFGSRKPLAGQALGQASGLAPDKAHMLLRWLAPVAMAYVAKRMFDNRQVAATPTASGTPVESAGQPQPTPGDLRHVLQQEPANAQQHAGLLGSIFDRDGDGSIGMGDVAGLGSAVLDGLNRS